MPSMMTLVDADRAGPEQVKDLALAWFRAGLADVVPGAWEWIGRHGALEDVPGPAGAFYGYVGVVRDGDLTGWAARTRLDADVEAWIAAQLDPMPDLIKLRIERLDPQGRFFEDEHESDGWVATMSFRVAEHDPSLVHFTFDAPADQRADERAGVAGQCGQAIAGRMIGPVARICEMTEVPFAYVCDDWGGNPGRTALDEVLRRQLPQSMGEARRYLRGYSWVTVVPKELVRKLGGAAGLERSGVFHDVREFPSGSVLLQATADLADYGPSQVKAVFEALRPVLPPGEPRSNVFAIEAGETRRLVMENAAQPCRYSRPSLVF